MSTASVKFQHLVSGYDTVECAYYMVQNEVNKLDYVALAAQKEMLKAAKQKQMPMELGGEKFLFSAHGTKSGYPFLLENDLMSIQFGEFNTPNFFVSYSSFGLWHCGVVELHNRFLAWCAAIGLRQAFREKLSRVDIAFDYHLPEIDFNEDNFLSKSTKDNKHRKHGVVQTFRFGQKELLLRFYNKSDEIAESSGKSWFHTIWAQEEHVWRIEWQVRKKVLHQLGINTLEDLLDQDGDLCRHLIEHTSLRNRTTDSNRSRWPVHPLWQDLAMQMDSRSKQGVIRDFDRPASLEERLTRMAISVYGYMKRVAAIDCLQKNKEEASLDVTFATLRNRIDKIHDPLTWQHDVQKRVSEMEVKQW